MSTYDNYNSTVMSTYDNYNREHGGPSFTTVSYN